ncbi:MAG: thiol-disulfide isomerase-like thioredoxin [Phycisphaerales bacterium]|nr:thiol-disulfide isomerase-like thioredoxin [Phycisphaerales bacterium]
MPVIRPFRTPAVIFALLSLVLLPVRFLAAADDLPRYDLPVGRSLLYSSEGKSKNADGTPGDSTRSTVRATVVAVNADGSRRVIVRSAFTFADNPADVAVGEFDVFPDGRARRVSRFNSDVDASSAFPLLPPDAASAAAKWVSAPSWSGTVTTYSAAPSHSADEFAFNSVGDGPVMHLYDVTSSTTYQFDKRRGVYVGSVDEFAQGYGNRKTGTGKCKLEKDETIDPARTARLAVEYDKLFQADMRRADLLARMTEEPENAEKLGQQAQDVLVAAAKGIEDPEVVQEFQRMIKEREENSKSDVEDANRVLELLGKPIAHWEAKDLDGKLWSRDGLKGKVVVMDFWYRGCPWCMYAMPQVKQLAADYQDKGVVVLGMNTDRKEEDAKFVVKTLGLEHPQVKAQGLSKLLEIHSFPTLIIIDQEGVIRRLHAGYSPDLHDRVARHIDELLQQKPAEPPRP